MLTRIARRVKRMTASQAFRSSVPFSLPPTMRVPTLPGAPACWYRTKLRLLGTHWIRPLGAHLMQSLNGRCPILTYVMS